MAGDGDLWRSYLTSMSQSDTVEQFLNFEPNRTSKNEAIGDCCLCFLSQNIFATITLNQGWAMGMCSFQKNATFLCSFAFFIKELLVLCILLHSLLKNAAFFALFFVLYKRMWRSLRSFTFFTKERGILLRSL